jgi:hypothetical protein
MTLCLTDGRYRFVVSFLEYFLMNGLKSPHRLLSEYIKGHINCYPESGNCLDTDEPELHVQVCMSVFEWDRLLHGKLDIQCLFLPST